MADGNATGRQEGIVIAFKIFQGEFKAVRTCTLEWPRHVGSHWMDSSQLWDFRSRVGSHWRDLNYNPRLSLQQPSLRLRGGVGIALPRNDLAQGAGHKRTYTDFFTRLHP